MLRFAGLISKNCEYDIEYREDSLISKEEFDFLIDKSSFIPLKVGFLSMNLEGFASFLIELSFTCFPDEIIENSLQEMIHEYFYPNLMFIFPDISKNYKENIRAFLKPQVHKNFDLELSLKNFNEKNANYSQKREKIQENKNSKMFELKHKDNMLNPLPNSRVLKFPMSPDKWRSFYASPIGKNRQDIEKIRQKDLEKNEEKKKRIEGEKKMLEAFGQQVNEKNKDAKGCKRFLSNFMVFCLKFGRLLKEYPQKLKEKISKMLNEFAMKLGFKDDEDILLTDNGEKLKVFNLY